MDIQKGKEKISSFIKKLGKRNLIVICSALLLGAAIYLNWMFFSTGNEVPEYGKDVNAQGENEDNSTPTNNENPTSILTAEEYFAETQLSRQRARDEAVEVLSLVVDSDTALQTAKDQAIADIAQIASDIENEANIESILSAKGFSNCLAVINNDTINIIVKSTGLLPNEIAQIKEVVYEQAGISPTDIKIIEKY